MRNLLAAALHFAFSLVCWLHAHTARPLVEWWDDTVLGVWEESVKSVVREAFVQTYRFLNGASAWVLSVFDTNYAESLRSSWKQQQDWHSWWAEDRQSTLNAVVTKYVPPQLQQQRRSGNSGAPQHKVMLVRPHACCGIPMCDYARRCTQQCGCTCTLHTSLAAASRRAPPSDPMCNHMIHACTHRCPTTR